MTQNLSRLREDFTSCTCGCYNYKEISVSCTYVQATWYTCTSFPFVFLVMGIHIYTCTVESRYFKLSGETSNSESLKQPMVQSK